MGEAKRRRDAGMGPRSPEETAQLAAPARDKRMGYIIRPITISGRTFIIDQTGKRVKVMERRPYRDGGDRLVCVEDAMTLNMITEHINREAKAVTESDQQKLVSV